VYNCVLAMLLVQLFCSSISAVASCVWSVLLILRGPRRTYEANEARCTSTQQIPYCVIVYDFVLCNCLSITSIRAFLLLPQPAELVYWCRGQQ
jgi:hypothetical protein